MRVSKRPRKQLTISGTTYLLSLRKPGRTSNLGKIRIHHLKPTGVRGKRERVRVATGTYEVAGDALLIHDLMMGGKDPYRRHHRKLRQELVKLMKRQHKAPGTEPLRILGLNRMVSPELLRARRGKPD
ncbi:MAG: hypothetical protein JXB14_06725 [Candidatus Altiarchaeota archaeon]|nr:hypothetical protein [Candidatus Altiarchaeota archaeon]